MRVFTRLLIALPLALLLALAAALWLALAPLPAVAPAPPADARDLQRLSWLLKRHDPRHARQQTARALVLTSRDLNSLAVRALRPLSDPPRVALRLYDGVLQLQASVPLQRLGLPRWLNLDLTLLPGATLPRVHRLQLGRLPVPGWLAEAALPWVLKAAGVGAQADLARDLVRQVRFVPHGLAIAFAWPADLDQRVADTLLPRSEQQRLLPYALQGAQLTHALRRQWGDQQPVPLLALMQPLFALARDKAEANGQHEMENRAALLVTMCLVNGRGLYALAPQARSAPAPAILDYTLARRNDTAKHYVISAVLAYEGGESFSNAIGLYKEVSDAQGGSGFSFNDLAADRAGTRFGLSAQQQPQQLMRALAAGVDESQLLPQVADLPENLQSPEFQRRFGGVGGAAYARLVDEIERRLDRLPLLAASSTGRS